MNVKQCSNCAHVFTMNPGQPGEVKVCRLNPPTVCLIPMPGAALATQANPQGMGMIPQGVPVPVMADWLCGHHAENLAARVIQ